MSLPLRIVLCTKSNTAAGITEGRHYLDERSKYHHESNYVVPEGGQQITGWDFKPTFALQEHFEVVETLS